MRHDGLLLALEEQRLGLRVEDGAGAVEHVRGRHDPIHGRPCRQAGGEVDRIAHHGVRPPGLRADVAGEDRATVDAGAQAETGARREHVAEGSEHPLLVVARGRRSARRQIELHGADVDVGFEPGDPVARARLPDLLGDSVEQREQRLLALAGQQRVGARDLEEGDRDVPVLGLAARHREMRAQWLGDVDLELGALDVGRWRHRARAGLQPHEEERILQRPAQPRWIHLRGGLRADHDFRRRCEILQLEDARRCWTADDQLAVRALRDEHVARAGVHSGRHPQNERADRADGAANAFDRPLHVRGGTARARGVPFADEDEKQSVATELEHVAAVPLGDVDQLGEDGGDGGDQLLRALPPFRGELLGQGGEARDVDRDERTVDRAGPLAGLEAPVANQSRDVRRECGRALEGLAGHRP